MGTPYHEEEQLHVLGTLMSALSEFSFCAVWGQGTEYFVPELCQRAVTTGSVQPWGRWGVSPNAGKRLRQIATSIGHWADLDDEAVGYVAFNPFPVPAWVREELDRGSNAIGSTQRLNLERMVLVAEWMRARRAALELTQAQVASHLSISPAKISAWENGRALPDPETVSCLEQVLGSRPGQSHDFVLPRML